MDIHPEAFTSLVQSMVRMYSLKPEWTWERLTGKLIKKFGVKDDEQAFSWFRSHHNDNNESEVEELFAKAFDLACQKLKVPHLDRRIFWSELDKDASGGITFEEFQGNLCFEVENPTVASASFSASYAVENPTAASASFSASYALSNGDSSTNLTADKPRGSISSPKRFSLGSTQNGGGSAPSSGSPPKSPTDDEKTESICSVCGARSAASAEPRQSVSSAASLPALRSQPGGAPSKMRASFSGKLTLSNGPSSPTSGGDGMGGTEANGPPSPTSNGVDAFGGTASSSQNTQNVAAQIADNTSVRSSFSSVTQDPSKAFLQIADNASIRSSISSVARDHERNLSDHYLPKEVQADTSKTVALLLEQNQSLLEEIQRLLKTPSDP